MSNRHAFLPGYFKKGRLGSQINSGRERALGGRFGNVCLFWGGRLLEASSPRQGPLEGVAQLTKALGPAVHNDSRFLGMKLYVSRMLWGNKPSVDLSDCLSL